MKVTKLASKGFSLVEMLVVIAIIGVIAAIAVPQISDFTDSAKTNKAKRNAQNLSSVCSAAQAAGLDFTTGTVASTVAAIVTGGTVASGSFAGEFFGVPNMNATEQAAAAAYLVEANGVLTYDSDLTD